MKKLFLLLLISSFGFAQNANRKYISHQLNENVLEIKTSDGMYFIQSYTDQIIETSFVPNGEKFNPNSHAVVLNPENVEFKIIEKGNSVQLATEGISVQITKTPFQIAYFYKNKPLISERKGYIKTDEFETLDFNLTADEILYGGGARACRRLLPCPRPTTVP